MSGGEPATETLTDSLKRKTGPGTAGGTGKEKKTRTGAGTAAGTGIGAAIMTVGMTALKAMIDTAGNTQMLSWPSVLSCQVAVSVLKFCVSSVAWQHACNDSCCNGCPRAEFWQN